MGSKLDSLWTKLNADVKDLWEKDKAFLFIFGILIIAIKFRDILIDILLNSAKNVENKSKKEDQGLAEQEKKSNDQANQLLKDSQSLPQQEKPVDDDWYKKT